jgi:hypothetical protein
LQQISLTISPSSPPAKIVLRGTILAGSAFLTLREVRLDFFQRFAFGLRQEKDNGGEVNDREGGKEKEHG